MGTLMIRHIGGSDPPRFQVVRLSDGKSAESAETPVPYRFPVEGRPTGHLMAELRWYLEEFLDYPFPPETDRADHVLDSLKQWGTLLFNALFSSKNAMRLYDEATKTGHDGLFLKISSDDPGVLAWPWEALHDPEVGFLAHTCQVERKLNEVRNPLPLSERLPKDRINILLVTARPYRGDVRYRSISRPLVEIIAKHNLSASVHLLRPPTFDRLREHLRENPDYYHILHFDGHGAYGTPSTASSPGFTLCGSLGCLVFEGRDGGPHPVTAEQLSPLLREYALPCVILNACQSAMIDENAKDPFASVAASLLQSGVRSVLAMAYSLYVSGAQQFLPSFYRRLFDTGSPEQAARAGRQQMYATDGRTCARGSFPLQDWLVPVLYQQDAVDFSFAGAARADAPSKESRLPPDARDDENPYGFIGRDGALLEMERAIRGRTPAVLLHGLGGVGKTTLARGFLAWLEATGGLGDGAFWFSFQDILSAEYVLNRMGEAFFGTEFITAPLDTRVSALTDVLRKYRFLIVWDNFEVVRGIVDTEVRPVLSEKDRALLHDLLKRLRGGESKVIITSRSEEDWLDVERRKISLSGLEHHERWEYCNAILDDLGIPIDRNDKTFAELMDYLGGHPMAMRAVLPKLEKLSASRVLSALESNLEPIGGEGDEAGARLFATLHFATEFLPPDLRQLLIPLALHEHFVDGNLLERMAGRVDESWTGDRIDRFLRALAAAGLLHERGPAVFEMHPVLTGFLRFSFMKSIGEGARNAWTGVFVEVMGRLADELAPRVLHEQRPWFALHKANFYQAMQRAAILEMDFDYAALVQTLGTYAKNTRNWREAEELFLKLADMGKSLNRPDGEAAAVHQLGIIAEEQRDFETARKWYLKSLEISEKQGNERGAASTYHQLGIIAQEQRDFETARKWYLKSLEIKEKQGNEHGAAITYHQLGIIAEEQRDFETARKWYLKSLEISERQGIEHFAAGTYHELGLIAQEQRDFETARKWYLKSLEIKEKQGNEHGAASTYHQLGRIAEEQRDFETARKWYLKSLAILEKQGNEHGAASTYHQLGRIAEEQRDFETARKWYLKSLEIKEKQGNEHGAASTYGQLGILEGLEERCLPSGQWFIRCILSFLHTNDEHGAGQGIGHFHKLFGLASPEDRAGLRAMWEEAGLPALPEGWNA